MSDEVVKLMNARFHHDSLISLVTVENGLSRVRIVDGYYEDGCFYVVTYGLSNKMRQLAVNPNAVVCGEYFNAYGIGENIGHPRDEKNVELMVKLRAAFALWYDNGDTDENDPNTCILRVTLTNGVLFNEGTCYDVDFSQK